MLAWFRKQKREIKTDSKDKPFRVFIATIHK